MTRSSPWKAWSRHYQIEPWFRLGDRDLATHLLRTYWLREGHTLTEVTRCLADRLGIRARLLPMCDAEVPTLVETVGHGQLGFQEYFVKHRWEPVVRSIRHQDCEKARLPESVLSALAEADIVLIAPSNPWLSVAPILAIPGMSDELARMTVPVVAITPIIAGDAVKGPTAKIMRELGLDVSAESVARFYGGIIDGFINDKRNKPLRMKGLRTARLDTLMNNLQDKKSLAKETLEWIGGWAS